MGRVAAAASAVGSNGTGRGRKRLHAEPDVTRRRAGAARQTGGIERVQGKFMLDPSLAAPGDIPWTTAAPLIISDWQRQVQSGGVSQDMITGHARHLTAFAASETAFGRPLMRDTTTTSVALWLPVPDAGADSVSLNTQYNRRSALRAGFTTATCLGLHDLNPAMSVELPNRYERYVFPLTDAQIDQLRKHAVWRLDETKTPVALALVLIGANLSETAHTRVADIDLTNKQVWVHDGGSRSYDRWIPIDDPWALDTLTHRVTSLTDTAGSLAAAWETTVAYTGTGNRAARAAAVATTLTNLMKKCRVHSEGKTRVESIREWLALSVYADTKRIEAVAARLGMSSLDSAAHILGIDWQDEYGITAPPPPTSPPADAGGDGE